MTATDQQGTVEAFLKTFASEVAAQVAARMADSQPVQTRLLKLDEAGVMLGVSERAVRKLIAGDDPALPSVLVGDGARRVEVSAVEAYIASLRAGR